MISVQAPALLGGIQVATTSHRGWSPEELAPRAADKIVYVGDKSHPAVQAQARAFKAQIEQVVLFYIKEAIEQDRVTLRNRLINAGHPELVKLLEN
jgi:hypothetical protein